MASAPGKVVLSGEYAVLDGAPAICLAVNRFAQVGMSSVDGDTSSVSAPGYTETMGRFRFTGGDLVWLDGQREFAVLDSVFRSSDIGLSAGFFIILDTTEFIDPATQQKMGIGSSAALTVALCAALKNSVDVGALARRAHSRLQGGVGSGVDVACSLSGGLIEYRMEGAATATIDWPSGLRFRLIWTGVAASSKGKLLRLDAVISKPSRVRLAIAAETLAKAWRSGDADLIIMQYGDYIEHLREFSVDHDLGIFDAGHDELWQAAVAANLVYKPCGAGGGDVGIIFGTDDVALDAFIAAIATKYSLLDCEISYTGARIEEARVKEE